MPLRSSISATAVDGCDPGTMNSVAMSRPYRLAASVILACVQASTAAKQAPPEQELAKSIGDLMKHLLAHSGGDFFQAIDALKLSFTHTKAAQLLAEAQKPLSLGAIGDHLNLS